MEVKMNKEIRDYQESMFWGLSFRQCLFSVLAILADALDILNKGEWQKGHLPERWDGHAAERIVQTLLGEHK